MSSPPNTVYSKQKSSKDTNPKSSNPRPHDPSSMQPNRFTKPPSKQKPRRQWSSSQSSSDSNDRSSTSSPSHSSSTAQASSSVTQFSQTLPASGSDTKSFYSKTISSPLSNVFTKIDLATKGSYHTDPSRGFQIHLQEPFSRLSSIPESLQHLQKLQLDPFWHRTLILSKLTQMEQLQRSLSTISTMGRCSIKTSTMGPMESTSFQSQPRSSPMGNSSKDGYRDTTPSQPQDQ